MDLSGSDVRAPDGTRIRLWEVSPDDASEAVLFVHGATYPTRVVFAPPIESDEGETHSWLRAAARQGRAAFAVDLRGYGESERPGPVNGSRGADVLARATAVVADVAAALESIRDRWDDQLPEGTDPVEWRGGRAGSDPVLDAVWRGLASSNGRLEGATC